MNGLIATVVGEERLDVAAADLVILDEPVPSAIRNIQRRGRTARQRDGEVHILIFPISLSCSSSSSLYGANSAWNWLI